MNIVKFLLERVEEERAQAMRMLKELTETAAGDSYDRPLTDDKGRPVTAEHLLELQLAENFHGRTRTRNWEKGQYLAKMGRPGRVIEESEVKLGILKGVLELHGPSHTDVYAAATMHLFLDHYIRPLARVYRDHPDYDEVWG